MPKKNQYQISARVSSEELDRNELNTQADRHGISINTLVVRAVREYIEKLKKTDPI